MTSSFMAADLVALLQQAKLLTWSKVKENKETFLKFEHFKSAIKFVQPMMKKEGFADKPDTTLEDVGGL